MKGYSTFPEAPALLEPHHQIVLVSYPGHSLGGSYPSAEKQSVYSTAPADWAMNLFGFHGIYRCRLLNVKSIFTLSSFQTIHVGWLVLWHINLCRLFNAKSIFT